MQQKNIKRGKSEKWNNELVVAMFGIMKQIELSGLMKDMMFYVKIQKQ